MVLSQTQVCGMAQGDRTPPAHKKTHKRALRVHGEFMVLLVYNG